MSLTNVGLRSFILRKYSRPYAVIPDPTFIYLCIYFLFFLKYLKIWVKIEKSGNFQQFLCLILQNLPALLRQFQTLRLLGFDFFPDPTFICNPTFIRDHRVVNYGLPHVLGHCTVFQWGDKTYRVNLQFCCKIGIFGSFSI